MTLFVSYCSVVEFENVEEAQRAISDLNDTMLSGRKIFVREVYFGEFLFLLLREI